MSRAVILGNIGTPKSPQTEHVAQYLNEFLCDPDVINLPAIVRIPLVRGLIVPRRAPQSALKYQAVWTKEGSPLMVFSQRLAHALEAEMKIPVRVGMRYGTPNLTEVVGELLKMGVQEIDFVPMFPQFAEATTGSMVKEIKRCLKIQGAQTKLRVFREFYAHPHYQRAMQASTTAEAIANHEHILFSFHGLPQSQVKKDPQCHLGSCCDQISGCERRCYRAQSFATARALAQHWQLPADRWSVSFQSRLGPAKWIQPYTDQTLRSLATKGVKSILVLCPAFTTDCLETLEEIHMEMRDLFLASGGQKFEVVSCLNDNPIWVKALAQMAQESGQWETAPV